MKLRNKKTGEIITKIDVSQDNESICILGNKLSNYSSLSKLNEEWEDYRPSYPLIKDEKIRKIIRAWSDENDSSRVVYYSLKNELEDTYGNSISFNLIFRELQPGVEYNIGELCGEEECQEQK